MVESNLGGLLLKLDTIAEKIESRKEEEARELSAWREERAISGKFAGKVGFGKGMVSKKPITDALLRESNPDELAKIVMNYARQGKEWAVKLAVQYIQSPETLNRLAVEGDEAHLPIERLASLAKDLGIDINQAIGDAEKRLKEAWEKGVPKIELEVINDGLARE